MRSPGDVRWGSPGIPRGTPGSPGDLLGIPPGSARNFVVIPWGYCRDHGDPRDPQEIGESPRACPRDAPGIPGNALGIPGDALTISGDAPASQRFPRDSHVDPPWILGISPAMIHQGSFAASPKASPRSLNHVYFVNRGAPRTRRWLWADPAPARGESWHQHASCTL